MAVYQIDKITEDVRIALDENKTSASLALLKDTETLALDELIRSKIVGAVKTIHNSAPLYFLDPGKNFGEALFWEDNQTYGFIKLPDDFMRLMVFRMNDWERPVYEAMNLDDPNTLKMYTRFAGIRGTPQKPKCIYGLRSIGRVLEFYSCKTQQAKVQQAVYFPEPSIEVVSDSNGIRISKKCYEPVVYAICSSVCLTIGEHEKGKTYSEIAQMIMQ